MIDTTKHQFIGFLLGLAFAAIATVIGCSSITYEDAPSPTVSSNTGSAFDVVVVDSCEYIQLYSPGSTGFAITHKGNCRFCKERNK